MKSDPDASGQAGFFEAQTRARRIVLLTPRLCEGSRRIALLMLEFSSRSTWDAQGLLLSWPGMETLTRLLNWNTRMVQRKRKALAAAGAFVCVRQGGRGGSARWAATPAWLALAERDLMDAGKLDSFGITSPIFAKPDAMAVVLTGQMALGDKLHVVQSAAVTKGDSIGVALTDPAGMGDNGDAVIHNSGDKSGETGADSALSPMDRATNEARMGDNGEENRATTDTSAEVIDISDKSIKPPPVSRKKGDRKFGDPAQPSLRIFGQVPGGKPAADSDRATAGAMPDGHDVDGALVQAVIEAVAAPLQTSMAAAMEQVVRAALSQVPALVAAALASDKKAAG